MAAFEDSIKFNLVMSNSYFSGSIGSIVPMSRTLTRGDLREENIYQKRY